MGQIHPKHKEPPPDPFHDLDRDANYEWVSIVQASGSLSFTDDDGYATPYGVPLRMLKMGDLCLDEKKPECPTANAIDPIVIANLAPIIEDFPTPKAVVPPKK
jgi:hypothetical protein